MLACPQEGIMKKSLVGLVLVGLLTGTAHAEWILKSTGTYTMHDDKGENITKSESAIGSFKTAGACLVERKKHFEKSLIFQRAIRAMGESRESTETIEANFPVIITTHTMTSTYEPEKYNWKHVVIISLSCEKE
jgi:hypothetical protein